MHMEPDRNRDPEAFSLYGEPLFRAPLRPERKEKQEEAYREALAEYRSDPTNVENIIWLGRRTAYLGHHREANGIYSYGIAIHPKETRLYRHRGHRFITIRRFDLAQADFEKAAQLIDGKDDNLKPDGEPNPEDIPISSLHFNIWYHLGLTYYLQGKFERALYAYKRCMDSSYNNDRLVATSHWLYMTLQRLGRVDEAKQVLEAITEEMDIVENQFYHEALLMYKGLKSVDELLEKAQSQGVLGMITSGYGLGCWYLYNGDNDKAREVYQNILDTDSWGAFGYIAAEADLYRLDAKPFPME